MKKFAEWQERFLMRLVPDGLAGDRQFLLVILLGNLIFRVIPLVLICAMAILWWFL